jgi:hypothetical protein
MNTTDQIAIYPAKYAALIEAAHRDAKTHAARVAAGEAKVAAMTKKERDAAEAKFLRTFIDVERQA